MKILAYNLGPIDQLEIVFCIIIPFGKVFVMYMNSKHHFFIKKKKFRRKFDKNLYLSTILKGESIKDQIKFILRLVVITLCSIGLSYQLSQLLSIYLSGKTSVDNRVERL